MFMRAHRTMLALAGTAGLLLGGGLALADDATPSPHPKREWCQQNPEKCQEKRARREAFCAENPEKCEQMKQKRAERREWCKQNPQQCEQQRAEWKQRKAELKAKCAADPASCDAMKQQMRERRKQRMGGGAGDASPPAEPPAQ
jgi:hypothetical protein